jgi:N-acetylmuramoyl-L-alanine amidase
MKSVLINPGHGGADPGAVSNGYKEAIIVKKFGDELAERISQRGGARPHVLQYGNWGALPSLINAHPSDIIISIHLNSASPQATGTETFYLSEAGLQVANRIQEVVVSQLGLNNRGVKRIDDINWNPTKRGIRLFTETRGVCVLVELAFISNARDMETLFSKWDKLIEALADEVIRLQNS